MIALLGLAILWAIVLLPDLVRRGTAARRGDSIVQFARNRSVLRNARPAGTAGRHGHGAFGTGTEPVIDLRGARPVVHRAPATRPNRPTTRPTVAGPVQRRRQDILTTLVAAALLSFLGFATFGGPMLVVHIVVDVLLAAYVGLWLSVTRRQRLRARVSPLPGGVLAPLAPVARDRQRVVR